jgi:hypothetical protein
MADGRMACGLRAGTQPSQKRMGPDQVRPPGQRYRRSRLPRLPPRAAAAGAAPRAAAGRSPRHPPGSCRPSRTGSGPRSTRALLDVRTEPISQASRSGIRNHGKAVYLPAEERTGVRHQSRRACLPAAMSLAVRPGRW